MRTKTTLQFHTILILLLALLGTSNVVHASEAKKAEAEINHPVCTPIKDIKRGGDTFFMRCEIQGGPVKQQPQIPCNDIVAVVGAAQSQATCHANCQACTITQAQRTALMNNLDNQCDRTCAAVGQCPPGKTCVRDRVINATDIPKCLAQSTGCQRRNPLTPALCIEVEIAAECTCKCQ